MATWNSRTFSERGQGGILIPQHGAGALVNTRVSISGTNTIDRGGSVLPTLSMPIKCGSAVYNALRDSDTGENHSLVYSGGTVDAVLTRVHGGVKVKDSEDVYFATLDFIPLTSDTVVQTITQSTTIDGASHSSALLEVTVSHGIDQNCGQATLVYPSRPSDADTGKIAAVSLGVNGSNAAVFSGTVTGRGWEHFPSGFAADCRDRMDRLSYPYGGTERIYGTVTGGTVEQNLVEAMGISSTNTHIEDDGNTIAVLQTLVFRQGDRFLPWIRENDQICGYVTYTKGTDSAIYRTPYAYAGSITASYTKGINIISARRSETIDGMYNGVQVDGLTTELGSVSVFQSTANSYIPNPPGTVTYRLQSNIIESDARGTAVALIQLAKLNIRQEEYQMVVPPPCSLEPADSITVTHSDLDLSGGTVLVTKVEHRQTDASYVVSVSMRKVPA